MGLSVTKAEYTCVRYTHNAASDHFTVLCVAFLVVANEEYGRQIPFAFLDKIKDEFLQKYADKGSSAIAHSLDKIYG